MTDTRRFTVLSVAFLIVCFASGSWGKMNRILPGPVHMGGEDGARRRLLRRANASVGESLHNDRMVAGAQRPGSVQVTDGEITVSYMIETGDTSAKFNYATHFGECNNLDENVNIIVLESGGLTGKSFVFTNYYDPGCSSYAQKQVVDEGQWWLVRGSYAAREYVKATY